MLVKGMYVRCPADRESVTDPRVFICAQVADVDDFEGIVSVKVHDPFKLAQFFTGIPTGLLRYPIDSVCRCTMFVGSNVMFQNQLFEVLSVKESKAGYHRYYLQGKTSRDLKTVDESRLIASFTNGDIDPALQLKNYEFQNPAWYFGRAVVSRSMNILDNSIDGFKLLAGSKMRLLPHQVNTVLRCLQESPCRYMLADEVGMGKTIEALSVLKIHSRDVSNKAFLIVVPPTLKEQWKVELLLKFNMSIGIDENGNALDVKTFDEVLEKGLYHRHYDFLIVDEIHRCIGDKYLYRTMHELSSNARNVLLLSATPVQQREREYLSLLRLLDPKKYDSYNMEDFEKLLGRQGSVIRDTALVLDDLDDLSKAIKDETDNGHDPHESEDCEELFEDITDSLQKICEDLGDHKLNELLRGVKYESPDCGVQDIKVVLSYICSNYQIADKIIRNRRRILEPGDEDERTLPIRQLQEISYELDRTKNTYETLCYDSLLEWLGNVIETASIDEFVRPLLSSFFSSPWAFRAFLQRWSKRNRVDEDLMELSRHWMLDEDDIVENIDNILADPFSHEDKFNTRIVKVLDKVSEHLHGQKVVLFTSFGETFAAYRKALSRVFKPEMISFFGVDMPASEAEVEAYRFQTEGKCKIMLCDSSGGEGRNFQCADYVVHIDLPWDASMIEQRIGRLDRLERDPERPDVTSVVVYAKDTFESSLFDFWNKGLQIFNQSLSGMEIIMKDIDNEIISAIKADYRSGLVDRIPAIIKKSEAMRDAVRKEQVFDAAGFIYKPLFLELKRLVDFYSDNENDLFSSAMHKWAALAGFNGRSRGRQVISYSARDFSYSSAINSFLIPPRWDLYLETEQNKFVNDVRESYDRKQGRVHQERSIEGTFSRDAALKNDYLHFFAPGDAVFDCIVDNAMNSCKGRACAFATPGRINWTGIVFVWNLKPDDAYLIDRGISTFALAPYRGYLMSAQIIVPISIDNPDSLSERMIVSEYLRLLMMGIRKSSCKHLGRRGGSPSPISQFKAEYSEEIWEELVEQARADAYKRASTIVVRGSNLMRAKEEMDRIYSAEVARLAMYGESRTQASILKREQNAVLQALGHPKLILDSAAYMKVTQW